MAVSGEFVQRITVEDNVSPAMKAITNRVKKLWKNFGELGKAAVFVNQGLELMAKAQRVLGQAFDSTVSRAIDLEKRVAEITTLLDNASGATAFFTKEILDMQSRFGTQQADLAKAYYQALSSGATDAANATSLLTTAQKLAIGGVTQLATATDGLTTVMNSYGISAEQAMAVSDALFIGMKAGKTTIGELSSSLGQAASLASSTGVSFQELIAAVSAVTTGGVETGMAVTQVRSAMVGLNKQTEDLTKVLDKLGIASVQQAIKQDGLVGTLKRIISQTDGTTESLTALFGRIEAVNAVLALTSDEIGGKFTDIMKQMGEASQDMGRTTETAFAKIAKTTAFRLQVLNAQTEVRLTKIGNLFKDILIPAFESLMSVVRDTEKLFTDFKRGIDNVDFQKLASDANDFALSVAGVGSAITLAFTPQIAAMLVAFGSSIKVFAVAAATASAPMILLAGKIAAVSAAIVAATLAIDILIRNFNKLPEVFDAAAEGLANWSLRLKRTLMAAGGYFTEFLLSATEKLNNWGIVSDKTLQNMRGDLVDTANEMESLNQQIDKSDRKVMELAKDIDMGFAGDIFEAARGFLKGFNNELDKTAKKADAASKKLNNIKGKTPDKKDAGMTAEQQQAAQRLAGPIGAVGAGLAEVAKDAGKVFAGKFGEVMTGISKSIMSMVSSSASAIIGLILKAPAILNAVTGIIKEITNWPKALFEAVKGFTDAIASFISDFIPNILSSADDIVMDLLTTLGEKIPEAFSSLGEGIGDMIARTFEKLPDMALQFANALVKFNWYVLVIKLVSGFVRAMPRIFKAFVKGVPEMARTFADGVVLALKEVVNDIASIFRMGPVFNIPTDQIEKGAQSIGDTISRSASQLFQVVDLEAAARGLDVADRIRSAINSATTRAKNIFQRLWEALVDVWEWVRDKVLKPIWDLITKAWRWVWDKILEPIVNLVREAWLWVWNNVILKIVNVVTEAFQWVNDKVLMPFINGVTSVFEYVSDKILRPFIEGVMSAFTWVNENIIKPMISGLQAVWSWIDANITQPLIQGLMSVWTWVQRNIIQPISNAITSAWNWVDQNIIKPFYNSIVSVFNWIWDNVFNKFNENIITTWNWVSDRIIKPVFNAISEVFQRIAGGFQSLVDGFNNAFASLKGIWDSVGAVFENAIRPLRDLFNSFKPRLEIPNFDFSIPEPSWLSRLKIEKPSWLGDTGGIVAGKTSKLGANISNAWKRSDAGKAVTSAAKTVSGAVSSVRKRLKFEQGGQVPMGSMKDGVLYAQTGALAQGTDTVPAMLTPGEFIINRQSARNNLGLLSFINRSSGTVTPVQSPTNISVVINTKTDLSPQQIRNEVIPTLTKELRKMSNQGRWVISTAGLRS